MQCSGCLKMVWWVKSVGFFIVRPCLDDGADHRLDGSRALDHFGQEFDKTESQALTPTLSRFAVEGARECKRSGGVPSPAKRERARGEGVVLGADLQPPTARLVEGMDGVDLGRQRDVGADRRQHALV